MAYQPIDNKTRLNTSQFTYISSGGPDYYLKHETSDNDQPWEIIKHAYDNIPNGDRYTLFLNHLYTNYFLIDLNMLSKKKSCIVSFYTTKDFSFSLTRFGNKPKDVAYFEGYPEDKELYFQFFIYKPTSYQYYIDLDVIDMDTACGFITADGYYLKDRINYIFLCNK